MAVVKLDKRFFGLHFEFNTTLLLKTDRQFQVDRLANLRRQFELKTKKKKK